MEAVKPRKAQIEQLREEFRKNEIRKVKLGGFDVDGVLRGKYVSLAKVWGVVAKAVQKEGAMGFSVKCASAYEFFRIKETPEALRSKGYAGLSALSPGLFGYSWLRASEDAPLVHDLLNKLATFDVAIESF